MLLSLLLPLLTVSIIALVLAFITLARAVKIVKRQENIRSDYFLLKKRIRSVREFKSLYSSYSLYRTVLPKGYPLILADEKINHLIHNPVFSKNLRHFDALQDDETELFFKSQLKQLELLSDDFKILYHQKEGDPLQLFLFWYIRLLSEIAFYKKNVRDRVIGSDHFYSSIEKILKELEQAYQDLNKSCVMNMLEEQAMI